MRYRFQELHGHLPTPADEKELWILRNNYLPQLGFIDLSFLDDSMIEQVLLQPAPSPFLSQTPVS